jgi:hypothetical protein
MIKKNLKQEVRKILNEVFLHWNIVTADRKIANSLKRFAEFFKFAKLMRKIPNELGNQKRYASRSLPATTSQSAQQHRSERA